MFNIPRLSVAAKLYAIFTLLATTTVALALVAVLDSRQHDSGIDAAVWLVVVQSGIAVVLAAFGAIILWRAVARPLAEITRVTQAVADGNKVEIPYALRRDEIGALSRSLGVLQQAVQHHEELNRTLVAEAEARGHRQ